MRPSHLPTTLHRALQAIRHALQLILRRCPLPIGVLPASNSLQEYNMRKKLEHLIKAVVQDGKTVSGACRACTPACKSTGLAGWAAGPMQCTLALLFLLGSTW